MGRIGELDLPGRLAPALPEWASSVLTGLAAAACAGVLRLLLSLVSPDIAAFALTFPAVMIATLFGRWLAGAVAAIVSILFVSLVVYPIRGVGGGPMALSPATLASVGGALAITILFAELFRRSVHRATAERDRELADRDLFLEEFDHRVKNNFAIVAALLDLQRRRTRNTETEAALGEALARVESIARAHRHLYRGGGSAAPGEVDMATYLQELSTALAESLFLRGAITLDCRSEHGALPRDRAVSIGLIVNELVTNAAKHAFAGRETGRIEVRFESTGPGWRLIVADDGIGMPESDAPRRDGGLGQRLIDAFVRQARGRLATESGVAGTVVTVALEP